MSDLVHALRRSPSILSDSLGVLALVVMLVAALSMPGGI